MSPSRTSCFALFGLLLAWHAVAEEANEGWQPELAVGFNLTEGNSSTLGLNVGLEADWLVNPNELKLRAEFNYGQADREKSVENGLARFDYNYRFTPRAYANVQAEWSYDPIADLDYRVIVGPPSPGYFVIKEETTELGLEAGLAYLWEQKADVSNETPLFRFKERFAHAFNDAVRFTQYIEYLPEADAWGNYLLRFEAALDSTLTRFLALRVSFRDRYDSNPAEDKKHNDIFLNTALVMSL